MIRKCNHFKLSELVAPELLADFSESALWEKIGAKRCETLDRIRDDYSREFRALTGRDGPIVINGVYAGQTFKYSGARPANCKVGAKKSEHKDFSAFDLKAEDMALLFRLLIENAEEYGLTGIEDPEVTKTWAHIAIAGRVRKSLIFKP